MLTEAALAAAMAAVVCLPVVAAETAASAPRVTRDEAAYTFADRMTFELEADASEPVDDIVLRYTVGGEGPINRRIPVFEPGTRIAARHVEDLVRGEIPPASAIKWWWTMTGER
jgi:hypothetical protein